MMRGRIIGCGLAVAVAFSCFGLDIVRDHKPVATIVIPAADQVSWSANHWNLRVAKQLQEYVKRGTGATLPIVVEQAQVPSGPVISLGHTRMAREAGVKTDDLKWDSARLKCIGNTLYLIGRDTDSQGPSLSQEGARGTWRAAGRFLEKYLGYRCFLPTPQGEKLNSQATIEVEPELDETLVPAFAYASPELYGRTLPAAILNNFRYSIKIFTKNGHTWQVFVPVDKYYEQHPEYFAMKNGKRLNVEQNHLCTSNEEVRQLIIDGIRQKFDSGYEWVDLGQSDGWIGCECDRCRGVDNFKGSESLDRRELRKLQANPAERIHLFHKSIIDAVKESHPDKVIHLLSYHPTTWPSRKFDYYGDNVIVECCHQLEESLPMWSKRCAGITTYVYSFNTWEGAGAGPKNTPRNVADTLRFYHEQGVVGIFFCVIGENWGLEGPAYYVLSRLLYDPDLDHQPLVEEYCNFAFGAAAPTMLDFFQLLYNRVEGFIRLNPLYQYNNADSIYTTLYPPQILKQLDELLTRAEREANDERSRSWVRLSRVHFDALRLQATMFHLTHAFQINPTLANLDQVEASVKAWLAYRDKLLKEGENEEYVKNYFPGWEGWGGLKAYLTYTGHCGNKIAPSRYDNQPPMNYDFAKMRRELQKTEKKTGSRNQP